jgi:hypothetical protein
MALPVGYVYLYDPGPSMLQVIEHFLDNRWAIRDQVIPIDLSQNFAPVHAVAGGGICVMQSQDVPAQRTRDMAIYRTEHTKPLNSPPSR